MKPAPFDYAAPATLAEAVALLASAPGETRLLAGGQTLLRQLNLRDLRPATVVALGGVAELTQVTRDGETIRIGAMVRQRTLETDPLVTAALPLLAEAAACTGHPAVRTRGTLGGSLMHADPAGELGLAAVALGACAVLHGPGGVRTIAVAELLRGPFETATATDEVLAEVVVPLPPAGAGSAFHELAHLPGGPAQAAAAAVVTVGGDGRVATAEVTLGAVAARPLPLSWAGALLAGAPLGDEALAAVAARIAAEVDPPHDPAHRRALAGRAAVQALRTANERAGSNR